MKRRSWWVALFAPQALAQDQQSHPSTERFSLGRLLSDILDRLDRLESHAAMRPFTIEESGYGFNGFLAKAKPINNQCPVCGTMAEPFLLKPKSEPCTRFLDTMFASSDSIYPVVGQVCEPETRILMAPYRQNLTRCKRCNAAFWQDAEVTL